MIRKLLVKSIVMLGTVSTILVWTAPVAADSTGQCVTFPVAPCAQLYGSGTRITITDGGTAPEVFCHARKGPDSFDPPTICDEAFSVCVGSTFEAGVVGTTAYNLHPSTVGGSARLCEPFYFPKPGGDPIYLIPDDPDAHPRLYNLDFQDLDGDGIADGPLPRSTLVMVVTDNPPVKGELSDDGSTSVNKCIGVLTWFQHRVGTCKVWKIRKYYNTCSSVQKITRIKEFELPCLPALFQAQAGPGRSRIAVAQTVDDRYITLCSLGWTSANSGDAKKPHEPSVAGGVTTFNFVPNEFLKCTTSIAPGPSTPLSNVYLGVFLSFFPGAAQLQAKGKSGSEKLVAFQIDVQ